MRIRTGTERRLRVELLALYAIVVALLLTASACGSDDDDSSDSGASSEATTAATTADGSATAGEKPKVLTTFTVLADIVRNVGGDRIDVESITKPGAEIHDYEPTPSDVKKAADADLVFSNGLGLERWLSQFLRTSKAKDVTLTEGVKPIPISGETEYAGKPNPHAWMSISDALIYIENIRKGLTELDPDGADQYMANAKSYGDQLSKVREEIDSQLKDLPDNERALVTCEGAFSYLARDLNLKEGFLWPINAEQEGTPKQIASTAKFVRSNKVPAVFCESTVSDKAQKRVASETGAKFGGVLYVDSLSEADGPVPTYEALLRRDADTIVAGLTGGETEK